MSDTKPFETRPGNLPPPPPPPAPPTVLEGPGTLSSYTKIRNEILAGGASDQVDQDATVGGVRGLVGVGIIVALLGLLAWWSMWSFVFVSLLLVCIFLHELGHFMTARWTGMKATQFFLFMGPKLFSFRRGETEYGVRAYPVGAFVRIIGMNNLDEVDPVDEPRAYRNQTYPRRMLVICAGSIMHMLIAIALLFGVYAIKGELRPSGQVAVSEVVAGSPASLAGLQPGDVVLSIDGLAVSNADEFVRAVQSHSPGDLATLVVVRDGQQQDIQVGLGSNPNAGEMFGRAYIGTRSGELNTWHNMSILSAAGNSITDLGSGLKASVEGVVKVL
ncbi:MAG: peptidase family protein, partial [Ilumatobacteraceae bacterium]|nr:peptidase family protein [Ilumatobacteraceae bacterium]